MDEVTIISYPGERDESLLSLTGDRSKYMLPFGGRFRVVDFIMRNAIVSRARRTILFNNLEDSGLDEYLANYGDFQKEKFPRVKIAFSTRQDMQMCYKLILDSNTELYVIYNGDNPGIIDFDKLIRKYRKSRKKSVLYKMQFDTGATLAHTILVTTQKEILDVIKSAMDEKRSAPNIFEMIVNIMINSGIDTPEFPVRLWPLVDVPGYYACHMDMLRDNELFDLFYRETGLEGHIKIDKHARLGTHAKIKHSIIADGCDIDGLVENSIVYPGAVVGHGAVVKDSVLLPFAEVGARSRLTRAVIDEKTVFDAESHDMILGERCVVGSETEGLKNNDFPQSLFNGITLIGKNCAIPHGSRIGGACYVAPGLGGEYFMKSRSLPDGMSILK